MIRRGIVHQRLVAIFAAGCVALTYPILALFDRAELVAGIPLAYAYVFCVWAALIAAIALVIERRR
jgi:hypothetical protein